MNICFFITTLTKGGAERVISNLANGFSENSTNKIEILTMYNTKIDYDLNKNIVINSLDEKYVDPYKLQNNSRGIKKLIKHILKFFKYIQLKKNLRKYMKNKEFDVVVTFLPEPSFMILSQKKYVKSKIIISDRNDPKEEYNTIRTNHLMKKLYPLADGFVFQTDDAKHYFDKIIKCESKIILNPVNEKFIKEPYLGKREKNIINVGRLEKQKNQMLLIKAFEKIKDDICDTKLIIYGEGSLKSYMQDYINENNLKDRIFLMGQADNIEDKIYKSSLFVLSSSYEGMPNVLVEAMCLGLPVISTDCDCGGPRMLIKNEENGILVSNNNGEELGNAMKMVMKNEKLAAKLSQNAHSISKIVNKKVILNDWDSFIKKIVKRKKM